LIYIENIDIYAKKLEKPAKSDDNEAFKEIRYICSLIV